MKIINNQSGIAHIGIIVLIILILGLVGFAGWRVYNKNNKEDVPPAASATILKTEPKSEYPEGFKEYKNEEAGFKFAYPEEWGEVKYEHKARIAQDEPVKTHYLTFSKQQDTGIKISPTNWKSTFAESKLDFPVDTEGFKSKPRYASEGGVILLKTDDSYAYIAWEGISGGVYVEGAKKLSLPKIPSSFVEFFGPRLDGESNKVRQCTTESNGGMKATEKCYNEDFIEQFKLVIANSKSL